MDKTAGATENTDEEEREIPAEKMETKQLQEKGCIARTLCFFRRSNNRKNANKSFLSSEESTRDEISTAKMRKMEKLQNYMKQIELEGKAKLATIHQDKIDSIQRIDEEKAEKLREHAASSIDDFNQEVTKLKREFKEQQTNIRTSHNMRMDSLNTMKYRSK
eukprot:GFUD01131423.1.p1 GENE.GFUD01131423.1~~GFUD01131423.1.p1  ORF type:complete len:162 (+),score=50.25 GFUD01131423.1:72-557(+)